MAEAEAMTLEDPERPEQAGLMQRSTKPPAEQIIRALGGQWQGAGGTARCPAHRDRNPSLSVTNADGKVLVHCHAGCEQKAVVAALWKLGLWPVTARTILLQHPDAIQDQSEANTTESPNGEFAVRI